MSATQPLEIQCPKCSQIYRFGANIPPQFACRTCQTVMDLRGFAPPTPVRSASPTVGAARSAGGSAAGSGRARPSFKARPPQSAVAKWCGVAVLCLLVGWKIVRMLGRSGNLVEQEPVAASRAAKPRFTLPGLRLPSSMSPGIQLSAESAWEGDILESSPATIAGIYSMGKPTDEILVNDVVARTGNGPFSVEVPLKPGENTIEVSFKTSSGIERHSAHLTYRPKK